MIISGFYREHHERRLDTLRKFYIANGIILTAIIVSEFFRLSHIPGVRILLLFKMFMAVLTIGYVFIGSEIQRSTGTVIVGTLLAFTYCMMADFVGSENIPFNFDVFTLQVGLILLSCLGLSGMKLFYSILSTLPVLFVYGAVVYSRAEMHYSGLFLFIFIIVGIFISGTFHDHYSMEREMAELIDYWKRYSSDLISDKLPKEYHILNAAVLYVDLTGIFSHYYATQSLRDLKKIITVFIKKIESERSKLHVLATDEAKGIYSFLIYENPENTDPRFIEPLADFAVWARDFFQQICAERNLPYGSRMGMHTGKFTDYKYEPVNSLLRIFKSEAVFEKGQTAQRESVTDEIQVTHEVYLLLKERYVLVRRHNISGPEEESYYFLKGKK
ncbi:MAG TPA: hypothetical protein PLJ29_11500 [Leptospiraceae bacterium]|nr:hypothetical protein [Leptospiraceae bacterium]